ncbi:MAG: hypothetical protein ACQEQF_10135 [Bacillota bacterium]
MKRLLSIALIFFLSLIVGCSANDETLNNNDDLVWEQESNDQFQIKYPSSWDKKRLYYYVDKSTDENYVIQTATEKNEEILSADRYAIGKINNRYNYDNDQLLNSKINKIALTINYNILKSNEYSYPEILTPYDFEVYIRDNIKSKIENEFDTSVKIENIKETKTDGYTTIRVIGVTSKFEKEYKFNFIYIYEVGIIQDIKYIAEKDNYSESIINEISNSLNIK